MFSRVLPVSILNGYIQQVLAADDILADLWVEGEITSITYARSGHVYFKLCEEDALIDGAMWRSFASRQVFQPRVGDAVIVHGHVDYYSPQGRLQLIADVFEHQGQGILALEMERLRQKLEAEGLFDPARKRPLPRFPRRVGVITSDTGAVWHDIQTVAQRRYPLVELVLIPTAVQGAGAPAQIVAAIQRMCAIDDIDVMIVGRGGGSPEDLAPFNDETVARAIFASTIPVVSAVGHETDVCIADFVADVRAATPSAATEIVLPDVAELTQEVADFQDAIVEIAERLLTDESLRLDQLQRRLLLRSPIIHIAQLRHDLRVLGGRVDAATRATMRQRSTRVDAQAKLLDALHPGRVLARGFALVEDSRTRAPIRRRSQLPPGGEVIVRFDDGRATGTLKALPVQDDTPIRNERS
jgi:exodeoxyribonuclease VII large subunit